MKAGDKVVVRNSAQLVEVHEVDGTHVTVRWKDVSGGTQSCTYLAHELDPYVEPAQVAPSDTKPDETKGQEPETKPPADETPKAKKSKR